LYVSPLLRCRETAEIIFPGVRQIVAENLRECDFGRFEYKTWKELTADPDYQRFIDRGGEAPFPGGESKRDFTARCAAAFEEIAASWEAVPAAAADSVWAPDTETSFGTGAVGRPLTSAVFVVHDGTIMALLSALGEPPKPFYDWHVQNGGGYSAVWDAAGHRIIHITPLLRETL
jgi:alpha-ribazole phosphatase